MNSIISGDASSMLAPMMMRSYGSSENGSVNTWKPSEVRTGPPSFDSSRMS
jgi:hypothetical protein